jgi:integrase
MKKETSRKINFTHSAIEKISCPPDKKRIYVSDSKTAGLRLQVTAAGSKSFQFQMRSPKHGIMTKTIGHFGKVSVSEARDQADALRVRLNQGENIVEAAQAVKAESTLDEAFEHFLAHHARPHKKDQGKEDQLIYNALIKKALGSKRVSSITQEQVKAWHIKITNTKKQRGEGKISGTRANRALALLSSIFNNSVTYTPNPCKGVKKFSEESRERFLQPEEMAAFFDALDSPDTTEIFRDFIYLAMLTGARRENVLSMKWSDLELDHTKHIGGEFLPDPRWVIPPADTKKGKEIVIPLQPEVVAILERRKASRKSIFVLATHSATGHYAEPKTSWATLCKRAGLKDLRIHDLRRTLGSYQTMAGAPAAVVGKSLGHAAGSPATAVYARMTGDAVKDSMRKALDLMQAARGVAPKVVNISGGK